MHRINLALQRRLGPAAPAAGADLGRADRPCVKGRAITRLLDIIGPIGSHQQLFGGKDRCDLEFDAVEPLRRRGLFAVALRSPAEGVRDFVYGVSPTAHRIANFSPMAAGAPEYRYEARTYFSSGGRGYDVNGMTREQLIADILVQFERYLLLVQSPASQLLHGAPEHEPGF